jgi:hypothetical protein
MVVSFNMTTIRIEAAQRLLESMPITEGNNNARAERVAKRMLRKGADYNLRVISSHEQLIFMVDDKGIYSLATINKPIDVVKKNISPSSEYRLSEAGVKKVVGLVDTQYQGNITHIESTWLSPEMRGKGFGKGLYTAVYLHSKHGIISSYDLGTMSLAVWVSLYKQHKDIKIIIEEETILSRDECIVEDIRNIYYLENGDKKSLIGGNTPVIQFIWKK